MTTVDRRISAAIGKVICNALFLGAITMLGGCSGPGSDLARELHQKSANRGLALARARGNLVDVIPFDSGAIKRECSFGADSAYFSSDGSKVLWIDSMEVTIRR